MSAKDVIKNSVYENFVGGGDMTLNTILLILGIAVLIGIYIFFVYKLTGKAGFYSRDLNVTIAGMPIIIAAIMIAMQSNLIVSLGMVGALSIVRFRNAVKNPLDLLYLFWTISAGIICGVGLHLLSVLLCVTMTILLIVLQMFPNSKSSSILILRTSFEDLDWDEIYEIIGKYSRNVKEKSSSYCHGETEVIFELRTNKEAKLLRDLKGYTEWNQVNFLAHDGEYRI